MNQIFRLLQLLAFQSFISLIRSQPSNYPLIFNTQTHRIYPTWESSWNDGGPYAIACPASYNNEIKFNNDYSFDGKSIIMRHAVKQRFFNYSAVRCEYDYQFSVAVHSPQGEDQFVEFGYEVFFDRAQFGVEFKESNYNDFQRIAELAQPGDRIEKQKFREAGPIMIKETEKDNVITDVKVDMGFVWLSKIAIKFDFKTLSMKNLTYFLDDTLDETDLGMKCDDYNLGRSLFYTNQPIRYYQINNQKSIFNRVKLPMSKENQNEFADEYVIQYNLLRAYQLKSSDSTSVSCSQLTSIPLWKGIQLNVMNYLERFLIAVAHVASNKLKITSGVHDILSFLPLNGDKRQPIYLYSDSENENYPAPRIVYKIVSYQSHECQGEIDLCWFDMIIAIHNEPEIEEPKLCKEDKCSAWGWDSIQYLSTTYKDGQREKSQFIYCCELDTDLRTTLGYTKDTYKRNDLNLKYFPYDYDENEKEINYEDMQEIIEEKMKYLFE